MSTDAHDEQEDRFRPANGVRARWKYAYDLVISRKPGQSITLEELAEALDMRYRPDDDRMRAMLHQAMDIAREHLESEGLNTVETKDRFGWIVLDSSGALRQAAGRLDKTFRAAARAGRGLNSVQREELTQPERRHADAISTNLVRLSYLQEGRRKKELIDLENRSKRYREIEGR